MEQPRIPVTIITGFLGAGKTTLLNQLIKKHPEKKFAIIENEFGEVGIDGALIIGGSDNIFELSNGCICCSLNNDLNKVLSQLTTGNYDFNHILVETTGIADPMTVVKSFITGREVQEKYEIDSVICLADAIHLADMIDAEQEVRNQLALSDIILVNKCDAVHSGYIAQLGRIIERINPMAIQLNTTFANIDTFDLLDTHAYSGKAVEKSTLNFKNMRLGNADAMLEPFVVNKPVNKASHHAHDITSEGFSIPGSFEIEKFNSWMQGFLYFNSSNIYRVKGLLNFKGMDKGYVFHAVRSTFMLEETDLFNNQDRFCKLVFIGKFLDRQQIEESLISLVSM
jgi:G3E family GTPase